MISNFKHFKKSGDIGTCLKNVSVTDKTWQSSWTDFKKQLYAAFSGLTYASSMLTGGKWRDGKTYFSQMETKREHM